MRPRHNRTETAADRAGFEESESEVPAFEKGSAPRARAGGGGGATTEACRGEAGALEDRGRGSGAGRDRPPPFARRGRGVEGRESENNKSGFNDPNVGTPSRLVTSASGAPRGPRPEPRGRWGLRCGNERGPRGAATPPPPRTSLWTGGGWRMGRGRGERGEGGGKGRGREEGGRRGEGTPSRAFRGPRASRGQARDATGEGGASGVYLLPSESGRRKP